ncbi:MAG: diguanylate cyclase, partial [Acidobacteriota bacterium]
MGESESDDQKPLILVTDDDTMMRTLLREALEAAGFRIEEATNGIEALKAFKAHSPDIVILDVLMPHMDGFEACTELRKLPGGESIPIVMITGMDDIDSINRAYETGATDFASKPLNLIVFCHRLRYLLRAREALGELQRSQSRLASAQKIARLGNWEKDIRSGEVRWSEEMYRLFEVSPSTFKPTSETIREKIHPEDWDTIARASDEALNRIRPYTLDVRILLPDGRVRFVHEQAQVHFDEDSRPILMEGTMQDITERKRAEDQIRFLAYYDGLTNLPNRSLFMERMNRVLESARRQDGKFGTLFLDLDRFKRINDTIGHRIGDRLLVEVAQRLNKCLRSSDTVARGDPLHIGQTVARLGGDEFTVLITDIARGEDGARVARRILDAIAQPYRIDQHEFHISASIGISLFPHDGTDMDTLLKNADAAMYHAKEAGGGRYQFYNTSMNATALQRLSLETNLRKALERGELQLYFQPQVEATTRKVIGAEALIHWKHHDFGLVSNEFFMPLAEETGLVHAIGEWAFRTACEHNVAWSKSGHEPARVALNISGREFWQQELPQTIDRILKETGVQPSRVELEIPEDVLMRNPGEAVHTLKQLRAMGLRICIDDFGS